jgi:hypothetical protein
MAAAWVSTITRREAIQTARRPFESRFPIFRKWGLQSRFDSTLTAGDGVASPAGEPSRAEVLLMFTTMLALHLVTLCRAGSFWEVVVSRTDDMDYVEVADIIRHWHFAGGPVSQYFWGFPYVIAAVSAVLAIPPLLAAVIISVVASLALCPLLYRLYGSWASGAFLVVNFLWLQLAMEGASEPLFMCLLYASLLAARADRWRAAALLASFATTVRPVGVLALLSFAIVLGMRRMYRQLADATLVGVTIGVLYVIPLWIFFKTPFANFVGYRGDWGPDGRPITYPFKALISSFLAALHSHNASWYTLALFVAWPLVALLCVLAMWLPGRRRALVARHLPEALFASIYVLFFFLYNNSEICWLYSRFLIPVLPLLVYSCRELIPRDRRILWGTAMLSALLSSAGLVHFRNVFGFSLR